MVGRDKNQKIEIDGVVTAVGWTGDGLGALSRLTGDIAMRDIIAAVAGRRPITLRLDASAMIIVMIMILRLSDSEPESLGP